MQTTHLTELETLVDAVLSRYNNNVAIGSPSHRTVAMDTPPPLRSPMSRAPFITLHVHGYWT